MPFRVFEQCPRILLALLAFAGAGGGGCSDAQTGREVSIGSHGATFKVRDDWRRKQLAANIGRDQFKLNSRKEYYAVLTESLQLLEGEEELAKAVRTLMPEITNQPLPRGQPRYSQLADGSERVTQVLEGSHSGIRLAYNVSLISRAGLTYRLMVWAEQANAREVERLSDRLIDGFSMPKAGTDWRRSTRPTTRTAVVGGHELTFRYRPSVFSPTEDDILVGLVSADREHAIYVLEMDASDADDQLDSVLSAINEGEPAPFKEQSRQDFTAGTVQGRMLTAYDGGLTSLLIALPLERERSLDIRYMFSGKPDAVRFDRDLFLESLKLAGVDVGLELPEIPKQPDDSYRNPQEQEVERISDLIAQTSLPSVNAAARLKDGRLLLTHGRGLTELKGDVERVVIESGQWGRQFSVASFDGGLVVADAADKEGKLLNGEGEGSRAGVAATLVAGWGNRLLYVPPVPDSKLVGFSGEPSSRTREVRCLQPDGGSRAVARLDGYQLTGMAAAADRDAAVVAATPLHRADRTWDQQRPVLLKLDLQTGESKVIAEWEAVSCVAPAAGAWLVTGTPLNKAPGVYLLRDDSETSALVTGEAYVGAAVEGGRLWYTRSTTTDEGERQAVYSAPLKKLANVGPLCAPYCVESVNQTARRWADAGESPRVIATEPQVRAAFAAASRQCEAGLGVPLPTEGRGVDQMIQPLIGEEGLSHDAMQLVAVVLAHCLLEQGAEWVPSERGELVDWLAAGAEFRENAFAQGHTPASLLTDTLFNSDGYWAPGERIVENASGRHVFIGLDPRSVSEAVRQAEPPGVAERLASGEADRVIELLDLAPQNKFFRESAYRQLAATSDYRLVRDVADHFVRGDHPEDFDTTAWLSARHGLVDAGGIDPRLANDLIAAINDHPEESVLYVLLGMVCEGDPQRGVGQSRLCYSRALDLNSWGAASDQAQERLDAIDAQAVKPAAPN